MKNLGRAVVIFGALAASLYGAVSASVDETRVTMGETVTYTLRASGQEVEKPVISELCGTKVLSTSEGVSMQSVNGRFTKAYTFAYTFEPLKDCRIEPVALRVDGEEVRTEAIDIRVIPMKITKDSPFILTMQAEKEKVYVGEPFKVVITLKQRRGSEAVDSKFEPPKIKNFWVKEEAQSRRFEEGEYTVTRLTYVLAAQKQGAMTIEPAQIKIATRSASKDAWGQWLPQLKWRSYFSNAVNVDAKPLPSGVSLVGNFAMEAQHGAAEIEANKAFNVTLRISGSGNFEDIGSLKPEIPGVSVFDETPEVNGFIEQGRYRGSWSQKFAFVAERNFTIPPFEVTYFDPDTQQVKTIRTEAVEVRVKNGTKPVHQALKIERPDTPLQEEKPALSDAAVQRWEIPFAAGAFAGFAAGVILMLLPWRRWLGRREGRRDLKDHKRLLMQLLPYRKDPEAAELVEILEGNLYGGEYRPVDAKRLKAVLKKLGI